MYQSPDTIVFTKFNILTDYGGYFTLNIPFFCQECGNCCKTTSFPAPDHFEALIQTLGFNVSILSESFDETTNPDQRDLLMVLKQKQPCIFLTNTYCQIYQNRPNICREWFPRSASNCGAFDLHMRMSSDLLKGHDYQVGIREVIYIGERILSTAYPHVSCVEKITKETLRSYHSAFQEDITQFWDIFLLSDPTDVEKRLFGKTRSTVYPLSSSSLIFLKVRTFWE